MDIIKKLLSLLTQNETWKRQNTKMIWLILITQMCSYVFFGYILYLIEKQH